MESHRDSRDPDKPDSASSPPGEDRLGASPAMLDERRQRLLSFLGVADFSDEKRCYEELVHFLHPDGLRCPRCEAKDGFRIHRRDRYPLVCLICSSCFAVFNAWTGTAFQGVHRRPSEILTILSRVIEGVPTARIARDLGCHRRGVLLLRRRLQNASLPLCRCHAGSRPGPAGEGHAPPGKGEGEGRG